jgi:nicotinic acid mononucleotide adenylyltransferase
VNAVTQPTLVQEIHAHGAPLVLAVTGGGSRALAALLAVPGASRTVLEATVPYASAALASFLGGQPEQYCAEHTARLMAMAAYRRARKLAPQAAVLGIGATASLASDRPKRGPHRVYAAWQSDSITATSHLNLEKGARSRSEEEDVASALILNLAAAASGAAGRLELSLRPAEHVEQCRVRGTADEQALLAGTCLLAPRGAASLDRLPRAIFSGAFNPLHVGHRRMATVAARILGYPVAFEISIENVDKPPLDFVEMQARVRQFDVDDCVWLSVAPTFARKSALFPGCTFVVGADTVERIGQERYYGGSRPMEDAIAEIAARGCRFLVFGRAQGDAFYTLENLTLPSSLAVLCQGVPASQFREDISSTAIRQAATSPGDEA